MKINKSLFFLLAITVSSPSTYGKDKAETDLELFFNLFERCRVAIETSLPLDNYGLELKKRTYSDRSGNRTDCDSTVYISDSKFLVAVFSCDHSEWDESRSFCSVVTEPEFRTPNLFDPVAWVELLESKYRHLDELGSHEIIYDTDDALSLESDVKRIQLNVVGTNERGCPVYNSVKMANNGSDLQGTSSESLAGKCNFSLPD